jgi:hypothetical protein
MPAGHTLLLAVPRAMGRPKARHNGLRADEQVANRGLEAADIAQRQLVGRRLDVGLFRRKLALVAGDRRALGIEVAGYVRHQRPVAASRIMPVPCVS